MVNSSRINVSDAPSGAAPLWIIALFIALTEVIAGLGAIAIDGTRALIFTIFAVAFPVLVFAVFIWILLIDPGKLYAPWQYTSDTSPEAYVKAFRRETRDEQVVFQQAIGEAIATAVTGVQGVAQGASDEGIRTQVVRTIERAVDRGRITVDVSVLGESEPVQIPVRDTTTVQAFLDSLYFSVRPALEPYKYNEAWELLDENRAPIEGLLSHRSSRGGPKDYRSLASAGIAPGSHFILSRK